MITFGPSTHLEVFVSKTDFLLNIPKPILLRLKDIDLNVPSVNCNLAVNELLQRSVLLGGKRLRPLLTYIFCDFFGVDLEKNPLCDICATSIEMVHAASLAHDDVIDEATMRRGNPSINIQASNNKAVLAGDYLLAAVINRLTAQGNLALVGEMSKVIQALSEGEWIQSDAIIHKQYNRDLIETIAMNKTSSVMSWCGVSAALISNHSDEDISELSEMARSFGAHLGLAFQLLDDTLDFSGDSQKDTLLDLKNGQVNSVIYEWLVLNPEVFNAFKDGEDIIDLFKEDGIEDCIATIRAQALSHLDQGRELLSQMKAKLHGNVDQKTLDRGEKTLLFILKYLEDRKV